MTASQGLDLPFPTLCLLEEEGRAVQRKLHEPECSSVVQHVLTMHDALDTTIVYRGRRA